MSLPLLWVLVVFLSGCVPGCGGDATEGESRTAGPVRLPPGTGGTEADEVPVAPGSGPTEELAEPPPVEPPPPLPAASE
jgi:hypothetical protein